MSAFAPRAALAAPAMMLSALTLCLAATGTPPAAAQTPGAPPLAGGTASPAGTGGTRAQLVAVRRAVISSEVAAKVASLPVREGQAFRQGAVLVAYDCALDQARLERAAQAEAAARQKLSVAEQMDKLGTISQADVVQARAALSVSQAETGVERVMVRRCTVTAPFSGRVGDVYVRQSERVAEGKELMSIYDDSAFEVETIVPSRWMAWLKPGYPMQVRLDETGQTHEGSVARIAGVVDPVSQSVKIVGRLVNDRSRGVTLLPGMSGDVRIEPPATRR